MQSTLKFYFKLVNSNLPHYFNSFTPQFSLGHMHYNLRNPVRQLPMIKNKFPKQSLRYKMIATLNEIPDSVLAEVQNLSQKHRLIELYKVYWLNIVIHVLSIIVMFVRLNHL